MSDPEEEKQMRNGKDLIGKPIISIDRGRHLGTVRDLYVDNELRWLAGVYLGKDGLISRKSLIIRREDIVVFGEDVVLAKDVDVVTDDKTLEEASRWVRLDRLEGRQVDTPGGTRVGNIGDILLDDEARVTGVTLGRVHVEGPIAEKQIILQEAIVDSGSEDGAMTIELAKAERPGEPAPAGKDMEPAKAEDADPE
jgi:uncharacterized protein YrrD